MQPRDFFDLTQFPGNPGTKFDFIFLHIGNFIQNIPAPVFVVVLGLVAIGAARLDWYAATILLAFFFGDWILLLLLPRAGKSFGPAKPSTLLLALLRAPFAFLPYPWWIAVELVGTVLVVYSFWIEPHRLTLSHQELYSPKLGLEKPLRVLHLGDIHVERLTQRENDLHRMIESTCADLILFTGDFLNISNTYDAVAQSDARDLLSNLHAPLGVFAVSGSPVVDPPEVVQILLEGLDNLRWLNDEAVEIPIQERVIEIVGVSCTHRPFLDAPKLTAALDGGGSERFRILLYHSPDLAPNAAEAGIDLQLSGHTHGGQVRIPFYGALYAASLYGKAFESGRRTIGKMTLYVTRGIGLEGACAPRMRFNCPPEVILWEIR